MTRDARCLSLYGLGTSDLQSFGGRKRVQGHVLSLERSRLVTVLQENPTESRCHDTLANITASTGKHHRVQFIHTDAYNLLRHSYI